MSWFIPAWKTKTKNSRIRRKKDFRPEILFDSSVLVLGGFLQVIDDAFDDHFFEVDIKAQHTDETEILQEGLILLGKITKGVLGNRVFFADILEKLVGLLLFQIEYLVIDVLHVVTGFTAEIMIGQRPQNGLDITDA